MPTAPDLAAGRSRCVENGPISRDYSSGPCSSDPQPDRRNHGMVATFEEVASETARQTRREFSLA